MKRSLMKHYIIQALYCHIPFTNMHELSIVAEGVLQTIEGGNPTGDSMLPPSIPTGASGWDVGKGMPSYVNEWEDENV